MADEVTLGLQTIESGESQEGASREG